MYNIGTFILNVVMVGTTLWIVYKYLGIFGKRKPWNFFSVCTLVMFAVFQIFVQTNSGSASIWTTIINFLLVLLISIAGFNNSKKMMIFEVVLFLAVWVIVEMIVFFCMDILPLDRAETDLIGTVISKIIMIIGVYIFSFIWRKRSITFISLGYYMVLFLVPAGSIYIAVNEFYFGNSAERRTSSMITFSILLLFNIIILEVYLKISENFFLEKEKIIYTQQINMMTINTEEQKKMMETFHRERHDFINKLIVLKNELEYGNTENAIKNIDGMIQNSNAGEVISYSGNKCVDALINVKYAIAREKGIQFELKIFIPEDLPINQCDIGVVLGNALDNAIEATEQCKESKKTVSIVMGVKKEAFVLVVKNPFENMLKKDKEGNLLSTKEDFHKHGYGITSIQKVAEKYHGDVIIEDGDGQFVITIMMNFGELWQIKTEW